MDEDDDSNATPTTSNLANGVAARGRDRFGIHSLAMFRIVFRDALDQFPENIRDEVEWHFERVTLESRTLITSDSTQSASELANLVNVRARMDCLHRTKEFMDYIYPKEVVESVFAQLRLRYGNRHSSDDGGGTDAESSELTAAPKVNSSGRETSSEPAESISKPPPTAETFDAESIIGDVPRTAIERVLSPQLEASRRGIQVGASSVVPIRAETSLELARRKGVDFGDMGSPEMSSLVIHGGENVDSFVVEENVERMEALRKKWRRKTKKLAKETLVRKDNRPK